MPSTPQEYVPTLDRARLALTEPNDLLAREPSNVFGVAAIVLHVDGLRRDEWKDEVELSDALFASFPKGIPPAPEARAASHKVIDDSAPSINQRCTQCNKGHTTCLRCGGMGITFDLAAMTCMACAGNKVIVCTTCDGKGTSVRTTIRYIDDIPFKIRRAFVPHLSPKLNRYVDSLVSAEASWPELLRFEPEPAVVQSAYRGAASVREPDFFGHFFGDALVRTLYAIEETSRQGAVDRVTRTYAVPILWLVYDAGTPSPHHVMLHATPEGAIGRLDVTEEA